MEEMNKEVSLGAEEQDIADPADTVGAEEQGVAAPASTDSKTEEDSKYAAVRRRERERFERERDALETNLIGSLGLVDSAGNVINTKEGFERYRNEQAQAELKAFALRSGLNEEELSSFINSHPDVVKARESQRQAEASAAKERINTQIKEISSIDPDVKSVEDLVERPEYPEIREMVKKGYSLSDAYKLVNFERITSRRSDAGKQSAINSINSKAHLTPTQLNSSGGTVAVVPEDIKAYYKQINPGITDAEIAQHWAKNNK